MDSKGMLVLVLGVVALSVFVSLLTNLFFGQPKTTTVIVERPGWNNYKRWWGQYGGGLPGWGGPRIPRHPTTRPPPQ